MSAPELPPWYPQGVNHIIDLVHDPSPYGDPVPEVLEVFHRRMDLPHAHVVDIAGGYGRYAIPLAMEGHDVTIVDIDPAHLQAAEVNIASLPTEAGEVTAILGDVTKDADLRKILEETGGHFDASLNLAFLYLAPPDEAKAIFDSCATLHDVGALALVQFSTNIERRDLEGNPLVGADEHHYTLEEGQQVLTDMFAGSGFTDLQIDTVTLHEEEPFYFHADVLIGSGIYVGRVPD